MNTKNTAAALSLVALACIGAVRAAAPNAEIERLKAVLAERFPDVKVEAIVPAPIPGLYEVDTATDIVYADATGEHVMMGTLLETKTRINLTAVRWDERNKIDFSTLPLNMAVKNVRGNGSRVLAVFSDPHCPFCQKLEKELETLNNTTVYTFLYPIESLHKGATKSAHAVWCAKDRPGAWKKWMLNQQEPVAAQSCSEDPIASLQTLGEKLKILSTPTIFLANGQRVTGSLAAAELEQRIASAKPAATGGAPGPKTASSRSP